MINIHSFKTIDTNKQPTNTTSNKNEKIIFLFLHAIKYKKKNQTFNKHAIIQQIPQFAYIQHTIHRPNNVIYRPR